MKVVIIGGGIAGMALAVLLRKKNINFSLNERDNSFPKLGHAFLMHPDAMQVIDDIAAMQPNLEMPGQIIDEIILKQPNNAVLQQSALDSWVCTKRASIVHYISSFLTAEDIQFNRLFSHFLYEGDKVVAAVFANGATEYGDIFIGADGAHSLVRKSLMGEVAFSPVEVKEIVGVIKNTGIVAQSPHTFKKYISKEKGLAVGLIPCSSEEMVWFMQFDVRLQTENFDTAHHIKDFCINMLNGFPPDVQEVLAINDFQNVYIWRSTDFDLMPSFHKANVALIGDAAHVALPFTSAGTTNALLDASKMAELLAAGYTEEVTFKKFYAARASFVAEHIGLGRAIKYNFLNATDAAVKLPLIVNLNVAEEKEVADKIEVLYFSDPLCSNCWLAQPQLRKMALEYGAYYEMSYLMGGLLPSWDNYQRGGIQTPADAARLWQQLSETQPMPISAEVWINSPLSSSFPPSIAIKAAQLQNKIKAYHFHRRIKELLFAESKNVTDLQLLINTAEAEGLNIHQLILDMEKLAKSKFQDDLNLATQLNIHVLPTFIFKNTHGQEIILEGYQEFEHLEKAILELNPSAKKDSRKRTPMELFRLFQSVTSHELSYLLNIETPEADHILKTLSQSDLIQERKNKNGSVWMLNKAAILA